MRLIDADELKIDYGFTWDDITPTHEELYELIDRQPTIEERKMGEWVRYIGEHDSWECSNCGYIKDISEHTNYCSNCGADMRGEKNEYID